MIQSKQFKFMSKAITAAMVVALTGCGGGGSDTTSSSTKLLAQVTVVNGTASFTGLRANYIITRSSTGFTVVDTTGVDGTTEVSNVNTLKFADVSVNLSSGFQSTTISAATLKSLIELYVAFFNRLPDADGLSYWIDQFNAGQSLVQISESFYAAAVQYSALTGYSAAMTNDEFVRIIYKNVLGRTGALAPPTADVQYWAGELASGRATKGSLIGTMLVSAHSFAGDPTWGFVPQLLDNKYTVAKYFAVQQGLNYNTAEESISKTIAAAAAITPSTISAAMNLIAVPDTAFNLAKIVTSEQAKFWQQAKGSWLLYQRGEIIPVIFRFDENGGYLEGQEGDFKSGLERGSFILNPLTSRFIVKVVQDTNDKNGLSHRKADELNQTFQFEGAEIVARFANGTEDVRFKRIPNDHASITGAFAIGESMSLAVQNVFFLADGRFMLIDPIGDTNSSRASCGGPGIEIGTYSYNKAASMMTISGVALDTNGCAGFNEARSSGPVFAGASTFPLVLSADGKKITLDGSTSFTRVSQ